ncbi:MAG: HAMP domain-containing histidine kinase [Bacteroidetes bacterium]|nr:HAMP domain-containing histidine kinase [Bacteroidota bacterium]MBU2583916.1 HAMP domain-containing histidine kinase [Bacteroidota bacterium]
MTAFAIRPALFFDDITTAEEIFQSAGQNKELLYLVIKKNDQNLNEKVKIFASYNLMKALAANYKVTNTDFDIGVTKSKVPIILNDKFIGTLYIGLSLKDVEREISIIRYTLGVLSLIIFIIGVLTVFGISTLITKPLKNLVDTIKDIGANTLDLRVEIHTHDEVGQLAATFNAMLEKLQLDMTEKKKVMDELIIAKENAEEANRLKSGFISAMSHEIRTPLNVILGYCGVIRDVFDTGQGEESKLYFDSIEKSGLRLINTITQILDISRIEVDEFPVNLHPISINKAVKSSVDQLKILAKEKQIVLSLSLSPEEPKVMADDYCLNGVLINLINNSIKYSTNGEITVATVIENDLVRCIVKDQGVGMSEEYQKHLFETFSQEDVGINRPYEGTGLGLALTKRYLEFIKGEIKVRSKKGVGTTVEIFLLIVK